MTPTRILMALLATLALAGCAADPITEPEPEQEFGYSVRHMTRVQTFNPLAGKAQQPPSGMDGARAEAAIEGYRGGQPTTTRESTPGTRQVWTQSEAGK